MIVKSSDVYKRYNGFIAGSYYGILSNINNMDFEITDVTFNGIERNTVDLKSIFLRFDGMLDTLEIPTVYIIIPLFSFHDEPDEVDVYHSERQFIINDDSIFISKPDSISLTTMIAFDLDSFKTCNKYIFGKLWKDYFINWEFINTSE